MYSPSGNQGAGKRLFNQRRQYIYNGNRTGRRCHRCADSFCAQRETVPCLSQRVSNIFLPVVRIVSCKVCVEKMYHLGEAAPSKTGADAIYQKDVEEMNNPIHWLFRVTGNKKLHILVLTIMEAVSGIIGVCYALMMRNVVDSAVAGDNAAFGRCSLLLVALVAGQLAIFAVMRWLRELSKCDLENCFKQHLVNNIFRKDYARISSVHTAEWLNRLTNDAKLIADDIVDILPGLTGMFVSLFSAVVMIIVLDRWFFLLFVPGGAFLIIMAHVFRKYLKRMHKDIQEKDGKLRIYLQERISNLILIKSFAKEDQIAGEIEAKMAAHKEARMKRMRFSNIVNSCYGMAVEGLYLFGIIYCAHGIMSGRITYGTLLAITQLIGKTQKPFASISAYIPRWQAMMASTERLMEAEMYPQEQEILPCVPKFTSFGLRHADFSYQVLEGESEGNEVNTLYPVGNQVLRDFSLEVRKGEYIALVGHSGCGKSTVLKLLMCIYPLGSGESFICNRVEEQKLTAAHRKLFAYVPQGNGLMDGTIRDIVCFAHPEERADVERISRALQIACADEFVDDLDAVLGERGSGISEGQMQRLALARAIFSDAPVLLLDEATSALDMQTEIKVLKNLRTLTDKTVIFVTHRNAALDVCDRIIRFDEQGV